MVLHLKRHIGTGIRGDNMKVIYTSIALTVLIASMYFGYKAGIIYGIMLFLISSLCFGIATVLLENISDRLGELDNDEVIG